MAGNALARLGNPYPRGDVRYARTFDEQLQDLNALTLEQVRAFHARFYGARFAQFGAAGDIDVPALQRALQVGFGDWNAGEPFTRVPQPLLPARGETLRLITPDKQNADLRARLPVPLSDADADYPALSMANYLLGSGGSSRLWKRIRETEGLSYSVHSQIAWNNFEPNSSWHGQRHLRAAEPGQGGSRAARGDRARAEGRLQRTGAGRGPQRPAQLPPPVARAGRRAGLRNWRPTCTWTAPSRSRPRSTRRWPR